MLYPQINNCRIVFDLSGIWNFRVDPENQGEKSNWFKGLASSTEIAVPGSWNEQLEEMGLLYYVGSAWYETKFFIPSDFNNKKIWLRFGSADYRCKIWINGKPLGENEGGFLPFEFEITDEIRRGSDNLLSVLVNNELFDESIPQGINSSIYKEEKRLREETFPAARFDFFPFGGLNRPVKIYTTSKNYIRDVKIDTRISEANSGIADIKIKTSCSSGCIVRLKINDGKNEQWRESIVKGQQVEYQFKIEDCKYWSHLNPHLYELMIELLNDDAVVDEYSVEFGVREVNVKNGQLLLNGEPVYLNGFGKHEDFSIVGKGLFLPLLVKDFQLMKWINANSFRTSHYPYSEEIMFMADRLGFLVIDEIPAVSLDLRRTNGKTLSNHKDFIKKLMDRDYNHPSVIMWALGNEPNIVGDENYYNGSGRKYWHEIFTLGRSIDDQRPMTVPNCLRAGVNDPVFEFSDIVTINRYYGWYEYPGAIDIAIKVLNDELELLSKKYGKPIMLTEFGTDTVAGMHSTSDQMFTEEYQSKLLENYINLLRTKSYVVGEHVWNFADFRTPQHFRRVVMNLKGVFTRERAPKRAAFRLKELWSQDN